MDLTSDHPFWSVKNGLIATYPVLHDDIACDIVIVGAGITGSMLAQRLSRDGHHVVVVDRRDVCTGSTSASTALLQYEIDVPLVEMAKLIGREAAAQAYCISHRAIDDLNELVDSIQADCDFRRKTSIYVADDRTAAKLLAQEARARKSIGLDVTYHDAASLHSTFGLPGVAALSSQQAASCDPYRLAHALLKNATNHGARVYDRTEVEQFDCSQSGVRLKTNRGPIITAHRAVIANGYEAHNMLREKIVNLDNTYALVSAPLDRIAPWNAKWMMWQAKQPYLYLRTTSDNRLLVGGEDDAFHNPSRRDSSIPVKANTIERKVNELLPDLDWEPEFAWAGTFGKTSDGLAYIGTTDEYQNCYFALGFGGNGITFSSIATELIAQFLKGVVPDASQLFRFGRTIAK